MKLLLFDIDGTILLTGGAGIRAMEAAGVKLFGERFSLQRVSVSGSLDPWIYREATQLAGVADAHERHADFQAVYLDQLRHKLTHNGDGTELLPGIGALLADLRKRSDVILGLVTGNYTAAIPVKLQAVGLDPDWFPITAFGDEAPDRPAMVKLAMERYGQRFGQPIAGRHTIVIGDTPKDVQCAHANGCRCLAVATGRFTLQELREAGADQVVPDLSDPALLLQMIARE